MAFSDADKAAAAKGGAQFVQAAQSAAPELKLDDTLKADAAAKAQYVAVLGQLASSTFADAAETLRQAEGETSEAALQSAGGGAGLGHFIIRAFQKRICGNAGISAELKKELDKLEKSGIKLTTPTAAGITGGIAATVTLLVASAISGPLVAVLAPLAGGITLLLLVTGVDGFCAWTADADKSGDTTDKPS